MAEIPVERDRQGAFPWWIWLLAAALLGGVISLVVWNRNRPAPMDTSAHPAVPAVVEPALVGRHVEYANVRVTRVLSDRVFTVTSGAGELFARLDDALDDGPAEQRVVVREGQLLDVRGDFRRVPDADTVDEQSRPVRLPPGAAEAMRGQRAYLHVTVIRGSAVH